jgi:hypothetical protein
MLKDILDETSRGCYDFMYLRVGKSLPLTYTSHKLTHLPDFANCCKYVVLFPSGWRHFSHLQRWLCLHQLHQCKPIHFQCKP